jgi:ssDNA-binding Zn-finger/Zn-ribbon topoisomerase 1
MTEIAPPCPTCAMPTVKKDGAYGEFWSCTQYPKCKGTVSIEDNDFLPSKEIETLSYVKIGHAFEYIRNIGGSKEAIYWLKIAMQSGRGVKMNKAKKAGKKSDRPSDL